MNTVLPIELFVAPLKHYSNIAPCILVRTMPQHVCNDTIYRTQLEDPLHIQVYM